MSMRGKVIAITGASSGIGEAAALHLAGQGAKIVLGARGEDRLAALAARIKGSGHFVNIVSTAARKTVPTQAVYSATKAAVLAPSDGLRQELAGKLRVTAFRRASRTRIFPVMFGTTRCGRR